jgi:hypothetical protein
MKRIVSLTILLACVACGQSEPTDQTDQTKPSTGNTKMDDAMKTAGDAATTATKTKTVTLEISGMT